MSPLKSTSLSYRTDIDCEFTPQPASITPAAHMCSDRPFLRWRKRGSVLRTVDTVLRPVYGASPDVVFCTCPSYCGVIVRCVPFLFFNVSETPVLLLKT